MLGSWIYVVNFAISCDLPPLMHPGRMYPCLSERLGVCSVGFVNYDVGRFCVELDSSPPAIWVTCGGFNSRGEIIGDEGHYSACLDG